MTSPARSPYQTDAGEQGLSPAEQVAVVALAAYLSTAMAASAVALPTVLVSRLAALGMSPRAAQAAGRLVLSEPLTGRTRWGSPGFPAVAPKGGAPVSMVRLIAANEPTMRARYVLAAAKRLTRAALNGEYTAGLSRERKYMDAHRMAGQKRAQAARAYDRVARRATYLRWITAADERVDGQCAAREGSVWRVDNPIMPPPGAVHARCRCRAVPA